LEASGQQSLLNKQASSLIEQRGDVGPEVGVAESAAVGIVLDMSVGALMGILLGLEDGIALGLSDGIFDGIPLGIPLGFLLGLADGLFVGVKVNEFKSLLEQVLTLSEGSPILSGEVTISKPMPIKR
jgi:hypothetical protein